ncbi:Holliday junction resolvase RuvX [Microcella alkaliphila]|uniref:Putative pre-16S rRNA nuclease n=1 Tax=Microcella alkaliphila TaxID=279828 RepID=A0A0U5BC69_9MICO|nr:Holliday junction resolvase RuvX [Microcella alkaliphila]BAU32241.1 endonuclease [Microcella alkaliphila]
MRSGVRLGIDVGKARVGVAKSDLHGILATPVETVPRRPDTVDRLVALATEHDVIELVVGLPLSMSGADTASTADARQLAAELAARGLAVRLVDERLTTVSAQRALHGAGRTTKSSRSVVDQVAAVILLQHALDHERSRGDAPGAILTADGGHPTS